MTECDSLDLMKFTFGTLSGVDMLDTLEKLGIDLWNGSNKKVCDYGAGYAHIAQKIAWLWSVSQVNCVDEDYPETVEKIALFRGKVNEIQHLRDFQNITPDDHLLRRLREKVIEHFQQALSEQWWLNSKIIFHRTTQWIPDTSQDVVMANFLFSNLDFIHEVLFDCSRMLKDDGHLLITDHGHIFSEWWLSFLMQKIQEFGIPFSEKEIIMPLWQHEPQSAKTIHIEAKNLQILVKKMLGWTPNEGLEKITIDLNKVYLDEMTDGEEPESEPWEAEYILIPYKRIARQTLSSQEVSLLKKVPHFKLEDYTRTRFKYWEDIMEGETPWERLLRTHMLIFEKQNWRGGYEFSDNVDQEIADFIAKTTDIQEEQL